MDGSTIVTPAFIQRVVELDPHVPLGAGELAAVVDAGEPPVVLDLERRDQPAVLACHRDEVGEVQLAGRRARLEVADPAPQPRRVERVQPGVDLGDLALLVGRVLVLDDPLDGAALGPHDTAEAGRDRARRRRRAPSPRGRARAPRAARRAAPPSRAARRPTGRGPPRSPRAGPRARRARRRRSRVARPGGSCRRAPRRRRGRARSRASRRRSGACRSRRRPRRARTRASAGRRARGGPSGRATSSACRDRPRGRWRRSAARARSDVTGVTGGARQSAWAAPRVVRRRGRLAGQVDVSCEAPPILRKVRAGCQLARSAARTRRACSA